MVGVNVYTSPLHLFLSACMFLCVLLASPWCSYGPGFPCAWLVVLALPTSCVPSTLCLVLLPLVLKPPVSGSSRRRAMRCAAPPTPGQPLASPRPSPSLQTKASSRAAAPPRPVHCPRVPASRRVPSTTSVRPSARRDSTRPTLSGPPPTGLTPAVRLPLPPVPLAVLPPPAATLAAAP